MPKLDIYKIEKNVKKPVQVLSFLQGLYNATFPGLLGYAQDAFLKYSHYLFGTNFIAGGLRLMFESFQYCLAQFWAK